MCTLISIPNLVFLFFFNDTATTEIYTLSLHDALPILPGAAARRREDRSARRAAAAGERAGADGPEPTAVDGVARAAGRAGDRKSTRLNSSHGYISYAVFCLKKKNIRHRQRR